MLALLAILLAVIFDDLPLFAENWLIIVLDGVKYSGVNSQILMYVHPEILVEFGAVS